MNIIKYVGAICLITFAISTSNAQSDPGISRHNYKHPNKAKIAKQSDDTGIQINTNDHRTLARYESLRHQGKVNSFPKYARRHASVVVPLQPSEINNGNNPLRDPANYKTKQAAPTSASYTASLD